MKKSVFITNIIKAICVFLLLVFIFTKNRPVYLRAMITAFLLLTVCYMAENLCKLFDKPTGANVFHKLFILLFLLFGAGFLIVWSYAWIKEQRYFPLLLTIPFWILGIYIFRRSLLGVSSDPKQTEKKSKFDFKIAVPCFFLICIVLFGIGCLVVGIRDTYHTSKNTKNYLTATCYFKDYEIYDSHEQKDHGRTEDHTTYRLIYAYEIDGREYRIQTDYGSGSIPAINSTRTVKYDPNEPGKAVFVGANGKSVLIYFGAFFFLGGMVFVLAFLYIKGVFDKVKINLFGLYVGFVFFVIGIGIIAFQVGEASSLTEALKRLRLWVLIPVLFILVGGFQMIKCLFFERSETKDRSKKKTQRS